MNDLQNNALTFQGKVESEPAVISYENTDVSNVGDKMNFAASIAMIQIAYEAKLINDATYRNIMKKHAR